MGEWFVARRRRLRRATLLVGCCLVLYCFLFIVRPLPDDKSTTLKPVSSELLRNLSLGEEQCRATFPGLMKEIDDAVAEGPFALKNTGEDGLLQARIKDGQVEMTLVALEVQLLNSLTLYSSIFSMLNAVLISRLRCSTRAQQPSTNCTAPS